MNDQELLAELNVKLSEIEANREAEPGFGSFSQAAYEIAIEGLVEAMTTGRTRWKYFDDVTSGTSIAVAWALNGGMALVELDARLLIWGRHPDEMLEQASHLALSRTQIERHFAHDGLYQVPLSDAQARAAIHVAELSNAASEVPDVADDVAFVQEAAAHDASDYIHSTYREKLLEHVFISEVLQEAWVKSKRRLHIEVLRSEIDASGYDIVMAFGKVTRHIQLKASRVGARTSKQNVNLKLAEKPAGCVVWMEFTEDEVTGRIRLAYRFFGGSPTEPLPVKDSEGGLLPEFKVAKHTKANRHGVKNPRLGIIQVPLRKFDDVKNGASGLLGCLFGEPFSCDLTFPPVTGTPNR